MESKIPGSGQPGSEGDDGGQVPEKADELLQAVRRRGRGLLDRQKDTAAEELTSVADVMHDAARSFEEKDEAGLSGYVQKAADYVERFSSTLREKNVEEVLHEAESLFRKHPAVAMGVTAIVGFAIGRFLRASGAKIAEDAKTQTQAQAGEVTLETQPEDGHGIDEPLEG